MWEQGIESRGYPLVTASPFRAQRGEFGRYSPTRRASPSASGVHRSRWQREERDAGVVAFDNPRFIHDGKLFRFEGSIFDKLTDTKLYTGCHKYRFDGKGRGRGICGRDSFATAAMIEERRLHSGEDSAFGSDKEGHRWVNGLRQHLYSTVADRENQHAMRSVSRSLSAAPRRTTSVIPREDNNSAPRFEAWALDANGNLVRDERRTAAMNFGPGSYDETPVDQRRVPLGQQAEELWVRRRDPARPSLSVAETHTRPSAPTVATSFGDERPLQPWEERWLGRPRPQ